MHLQSTVTCATHRPRRARLTSLRSIDCSFPIHLDSSIHYHVSTSSGSCSPLELLFFVLGTRSALITSLGIIIIVFFVLFCSFWRDFGDCHSPLYSTAQQRCPSASSSRNRRLSARAVPSPPALITSSPLTSARTTHSDSSSRSWASTSPRPSSCPAALSSSARRQPAPRCASWLTIWPIPASTRPSSMLFCRFS